MQHEHYSTASNEKLHLKSCFMKWKIKHAAAAITCDSDFYIKVYYNFNSIAWPCRATESLPWLSVSGELTVYIVNVFGISAKAFYGQSSGKPCLTLNRQTQVYVFRWDDSPQKMSHEAWVKFFDVWWILPVVQPDLSETSITLLLQQRKQVLFHRVV